MIRRALLVSLTLAAGCSQGDSGQPAPPGGGGQGSCLASALLSDLGADRLVVGVSAGDAAAAEAPYHLRYQYIAGGVAPGAGPCASCTLAGCGGWWGCWQWDQLPPGQFATSFIAAAGGASPPQVPMFTYYQLLQSMSAPAEGAAEVAAASDPELMARYLADFRFLLGRIGSSRVLLHVEPDFWGFAQRLAGDPAQIPAAVAAANPEDCAGMPDTIAGLARCMIAMVRSYAPNARVGLHVSAWAPSFDCFRNANPVVDCAAEGTRAGLWMKAAGADLGDFVVADPSDRDADWYLVHRGEDRWWRTDGSLPGFGQAFAWTRAMAEAVGLPVLWWQVPLGNSLQDNTANHYRDNRVEYLFEHLGDAAAAHVAGIAFGAGDGAQTTPETDGGVLRDRTRAYAAGPGQAACAGP